MINGSWGVRMGKGQLRDFSSEVSSLYSWTLKLSSARVLSGVQLISKCFSCQKHMAPASQATLVCTPPVCTLTSVVPRTSSPCSVLASTVTST